MRVAQGWKKRIIFYDRYLLLTIIPLFAIGLLMVASASMVISDREYHFPFYYLIKQSIYLGIGLSLMVGVTFVPVSVLEKVSGYLFFLSVMLLLMVLVPGIGKVVNGSRRWLNLNLFSIQVSEILKLCTILYLSSYLSRYAIQVKKDVFGFIKPIMLLFVIDVLLLLEPDFGACAVLTITFFSLLFLSGVRLWIFLLFFFLATVMMTSLALIAPYRLIRMVSFLNPWMHQFGSGYQLTQSLIAFGRGGLWGVGLGNSIQKLYYLPEAHTDFVFAVLAEELGLIGVLVLVILFILFIGRLFMIGVKAHKSGQHFAGYVQYGIALWLGLQVLINMGVNTGLLPTKGLTLPFISYGGSSLLVNCLALGVVFRIAYETMGDDQRHVNKRQLTHY